MAQGVCRAGRQLAPIDGLSGAGDRLFYSGGHRRHGVDLRFVTDPHGELIWASPTLSGSVHDLAVARERALSSAWPSGRSLAALRDIKGRWRHRYCLRAEEGPQAGEVQGASPETKKVDSRRTLVTRSGCRSGGCRWPARGWGSAGTGTATAPGDQRRCAIGSGLEGGVLPFRAPGQHAAGQGNRRIDPRPPVTFTCGVLPLCVCR